MTADRRPRLLITGGAGLLGRALLATLPPHVDCHATQHRTPVRGATAHPIDLAEPAAVQQLWQTLRPNVVIHTAYRAQSAERDLWRATLNVVAATRQIGAQLIHLSSDMVFDGQRGPYDEAAAPHPVNDYGRYKARLESHVQAELPHAAIIRTSLLTQFDPLDERSAWVADSLRQGTPLTLFVDELRMPLSPVDLAQQLWEIVALPREAQAGIWHLVGAELINRYALGLLIAAQQRLDPRGITPAWAADHPAPRPRVLHLLSDRTAQLRHSPRPISAVATAGGRAMPVG
ncbi:MAG: sugar nucleotide-binding protein [Ardenticatenales bacterium]|nr:sugar nucleotide-binding protein [Ardenticatenales bacterium]